MSEIKSKPRYTTLKPDLNGRRHVLAGQGSGGQALLRLLKEMPPRVDIRVLYATESLANKHMSEQLQALDLTELLIFSAQEDALANLDQVLSLCGMGMRLYVAGSDSFLGSAVQTALKYNVYDDEMQCERSGSAARRVYCVHCRTTNENVTTNLVQCAGCQRHLFVRDHYSRRLAAYMGFMIDAETPGDLPPIEEIYS